MTSVPADPLPGVSCALITNLGNYEQTVTCAVCRGGISSEIYGAGAKALGYLPTPEGHQLLFLISPLQSLLQRTSGDNRLLPLSYRPATDAISSLCKYMIAIAEIRCGQQQI